MSAAERLSESDDEVRQNISPALVELFNRVRGQIKGTKRKTRTEVCVIPRRPSFTGDGKTDATEYAWFLWGTDRPGTWSILRVDPAPKRKRR